MSTCVGASESWPATVHGKDQRRRRRISAGWQADPNGVARGRAGGGSWAGWTSRLATGKGTGTARVVAVGDNAIAGINAAGEAVVVDYDKLFQVEERQTQLTRVPGAETGGNVIKGATNSVLLAACLAAMFGGGMAVDCPQIGD